MGGIEEILEEREIIKEEPEEELEPEIEEEGE